MIELMEHQLEAVPNSKTGAFFTVESAVASPLLLWHIT